jgi:hypothetical protein
MKIPVLSIVLLFSFVSCQKNQPGSLTTENKKQITEKIQNKLDDLFVDSVNVDLEKSLRPIWNSPDFIYLSNGITYSYRELKEMEKENLTSFKKQKFDFPFNRIEVINDSLAFVNLQGSLTTTYNNDDRATSLIAETMIFKFIDKDWKVTFAHESYAPEVKK